MSLLPGKDHTGPGPKAGSNHFRLYSQEFKAAAAAALPQTKSWLTAAETKKIPCPCQLFLLVLLQQMLEICKCSGLLNTYIKVNQSTPALGNCRW